MKRKIIGIFVMTLLITSSFLTIGNAEKTKYEETNESSIIDQFTDKKIQYKIMETIPVKQPLVKTEGNLAPNPSFEGGSGDKPTGWNSFAEQKHWDDSEAHTGEKSVGISGVEHSYHDYSWYSDFIPVDFTSNIYNISAWAKGEGEHIEDQWAFITFSLFDKNKQSISSDGLIYKIPTSSEWQVRYAYATCSGEIAEETKYIVLSVGQICWTSEDPNPLFNVYIDDVYFGVTENSPPETPIIEGPIEGNIEETYDFNVIFNDPDAYSLFIYIDWGDGTNSDWIPVWSRPDEPGTYTFNHSWAKKGDYIIKAKVKDEIGAESDWATLEVSMPKNKAINTPFINFLENHPHLFPLLQQLLGLT